MLAHVHGRIRLQLRIRGMRLRLRYPWEDKIAVAVGARAGVGDDVVRPEQAQLRLLGLRRWIAAADNIAVALRLRIILRLYCGCG